MKTLYLSDFIRGALAALQIRENSLDAEINGNDLRAIAKMLDVAEKRKAKKEKFTPAA